MISSELAVEGLEEGGENEQGLSYKDKRYERLSVVNGLCELFHDSRCTTWKLWLNRRGGYTFTQKSKFGGILYM